jgi:hypothetical protein
MAPLASSSSDHRQVQHRSLSQVVASLPPEWPDNARYDVRRAKEASSLPILVVLDDDVSVSPLV